MNSKILDTLGDISPFDDDIRQILAFTQANQNYSEFSIGDWKTYVLRNASGLDDDGLVVESDLPLKVTPRGAALHSINQWIDSYFDSTHLRLVRVHSMGDGVLVPHRDFLEFDERADRWLRVHLTIKTNNRCLHSEEAEVFHMRLGEIWQLDATRLHSATNGGEEQRLNLCLDFDLRGAAAESVFRVPPPSAKLPSPLLISRPPLDASFLNGLLGLSTIMDEMNYRDIVGLLSKVHFYRDASLLQFFDWLVEIARRSGSTASREKSEAFCRFLRAERAVNERFVL